MQERQGVQIDISIVCPQCYFTFLLNIILSAFDAMFGQLFFVKQNNKVYTLPNKRPFFNYVDQILPIIDYLPTFKVPPVGKGISSPMSTGVGQVVNNGQNLVNVVKERTPRDQTYRDKGMQCILLFRHEILRIGVLPIAEQGCHTVCPSFEIPDHIVNCIHSNPTRKTNLHLLQNKNIKLNTFEERQKSLPVLLWVQKQMGRFNFFWGWDNTF